VDLRGSAHVLGCLVEVGGGKVEPTGHLPQPQTDAVLGVVEPGIKRVRTADSGSGVTASGDVNATIDCQVGTFSRPLVRERLLCLWVVRRGKSRLCGVGAELKSNLVSGQSKVGEQVANLLLAGVDNPTSGCLVDGGGDISAELLEADAELLLEGVRRQRGGRWTLASPVNAG
jgi:hypothetical protein